MPESGGREHKAGPVSASLIGPAEAGERQEATRKGETHIELNLRDSTFYVNGERWGDVTARIFNILEFVSRPGQRDSTIVASEIEGAVGVSAVRQAAPDIHKLFEAHGIPDPGPILTVKKETLDGRPQWVFQWHAEPDGNDESEDDQVRRFKAILP
jgi:hypothetical protein